MFCGWFGGECRFVKFIDCKKRNLFTDVSFIVEGDTFKAHKIVLASRSEVFQTMFTTDMNEAACNEVRVSDIKKNIFEIFLDYLYSGVVSYEQVHEHYFELLYCADKYSIGDLTRACSDLLMGSFKVDTFVEVLRAACFFKVENLKMRYIARIAEYDNDYEHQTIEDSEEWTSMVSDVWLVREIVSSLSPTAVSSTYNLTPDVWDHGVADFESEGNDDVNLRVNGLEIKLSISLRARQNTLYGFARLFSHDYLDRAVEILHTFTISTAEKKVIHSGQGVIWWVSGAVSDDDRSTYMSPCTREEYYRQKSLFPLFEIEFDEKPGVKNTDLIVDLDLKQWEPPESLIEVVTALEPPRTSEMKVEDDHLKYDVARLSVDNQIFVVNRALYRNKGDFFCVLLSDSSDQYRIDGIDASTFSTIERFLSNNVIPDKDEVNDKLMMAASQLLLKDLVSLCEGITATKLTVDNAVSTLILAKDLHMENLQRMVIDFIDSHHLKIVRLDNWTHLDNHPDLNSSILKKMLGRIPYQGPLRKASERKSLNMPCFMSSETSMSEEYWTYLSSEDSENDDEHAEEQV